MAHKIKIKPVPRMRQDGTPGTKKDYVVRCKHRGKICTEKKFEFRRDAVAEVETHWELVNTLHEAQRNVERGSFPSKFRAEYLRMLRHDTWRETPEASAA